MKKVKKTEKFYELINDLDPEDIYIFASKARALNWLKGGWLGDLSLYRSTLTRQKVPLKNDKSKGR